MEFRPTLVGRSRTTSVRVKNAGRASIAIQAELKSPSPFSVSAPAQLAPGEETSLTVTFRPESAGTASASLVVRGESAQAELVLFGDGVICQTAPHGCRIERWDEESARCVEVNRTDGAPCTSLCAWEGYCHAGSCTPISGPDCDDDNPCTADSCDESLGCVHRDATDSCPHPAEPCRVAVCDAHTGCGVALAADGVACEDGCTVGTCQAGLCVGSRRTCDDGNPCTADRCDDVLGCVNEDATAACPVPGPCHAPVCDPESGCSSRPLADGTPCGPATCETIHFCESGQCIASPTPDDAACGCNDQRVAQKLSPGLSWSTCRITDEATVECWGGNDLGQIGDGTFENRLSPTPVVGLSDVVEVSVGANHACARTTAGRLYCWGNNHSQQVSAHAPLAQPLPFLISELSDVVSVSAGWGFTCAVTADGSVWCWGDNSVGQIGDGTYNTVPGGKLIRPITRVHGIANAVTVSVSEYLACALLRDSTVTCWGDSVAGYLGDPLGRRASPVPVPAVTPSGLLHGVVEVRVGAPYICVRTLFGEIRCTPPRHRPESAGPIPVSTYPEVGPWFGRVEIGGCATQLTAGYYQACARLPDTSVRCWGSSNWSGGLGNGTTSLPPNWTSDVSGLTGVKEISTSGHHTCALMYDGTYRCWGYNYRGELGDGTTTPRYAP